MSVAAASATWLTGTAVGTFARAACVLIEPTLTGITIGRHRAFGEVAALVGFDHHAPRTCDRGNDDEDQRRETTH
jgi:hypothetical protein